MSKNLSLSGKIIFEDNLLSGSIYFEETINEIKIENNKNYDNYIIPGFVDLHCHGGKGYDCMEGLESIKNMSNYHLVHGTTTLYPTTVTAVFENTFNALKGLNKYLNINKNITNIEGIHLEGPFINPDKLGAQPPFAQLPSQNFVKKLMQEAPIKIMTLAPELKNGIELIKFLVKNNIKPQIGHSLADYKCCILAIQNGVKSITHLYNAMTKFNHKKPGVIEAALNESKFSEIICDLIHVDKQMIRLASKNIEKLYSITDSISASGMPDGEYKIGTQIINKKDGVAKLDKNTLGGSIITMDKTFKNLIDIGFSIQESVKMTSTNAADYLGKKDIGKIIKGSKANLVLLDNEFNLIGVYLNGNKVLLK